MSHVSPGGNWKEIPEELRTKAMGKATHSNTYRRLDPNKPSITLINYRKCSLIHPKLDRGLSVREGARLMDIPDNYEFVGSIPESQQALGNAIPLNLVRVVGKIMRKHYQVNVCSGAIA